MKNKKCIKQKLLSSSVVGVALTTNYWTSLANENYGGFAAHYIDENFHLKTVLPAVDSIDERHYEENIEHVKTVIDAWELESKAVSIATDSARNMVNAVYVLGHPPVPCADIAYNFQ